MDGAWWAAVHGVAKSRTRLSDFTFTLHFHALEKKMATHSNVLAWRIPGTGEPYGLPSMGLHRVRHDWSDLAAAAAAGLPERLQSVKYLASIINSLVTCGLSIPQVNLTFSDYCFWAVPLTLWCLKSEKWRTCSGKTQENFFRSKRWQVVENQ